MSVGGRSVGVHPGALLADEQRDNLEFGPGRRLDRGPLDSALDLPDGLRQDRDQALGILGRPRLRLPAAPLDPPFEAPRPPELCFRASPDCRRVSPASRRVSPDCRRPEPLAAPDWR
ncbi:hypothetical protein GCM10029976_012720 [Kribbella albertanoniae]